MTRAAPNTGPDEFDGATVPMLEALRADTPEEEIHQRAALSKGGRPVVNKDGQPLLLDYVTARFVQDRLDDAVGPSNWQSMFVDIGGGVTRCGIGIFVARAVGNPEWVWKWDVGTPSTIEAEKGSHSDAFKRAAVQWGIARDLYDERNGDGGASETPAAVVPDAPATQTVRQQAEAPVAAPEAPQATSAWACPIHTEVKVVPGGVSRRTGRPYKAFYACPVPGCDEKGPSVS